MLVTDQLAADIENCIGCAAPTRALNCMNRTTAMTSPKSVYDENATARPSGMLCSVIVNAISKPSLHFGST